MKKLVFLFYIIIVLTVVSCSSTNKPKNTPTTTPKPSETAKVIISENETTTNTTDQETIDWLGSYEYDLVFETEGQEIKNIISYELNIYKQEDELLADLSANGYMTSLGFHCRCVAENNKLKVYYLEESDEDPDKEPTYEKGEHLLTLEMRKRKLITYWEKFEPEGEIKNGTVYFKKQ
jgi:hypothetical protein